MYHEGEGTLYLIGFRDKTTVQYDSGRVSLNSRIDPDID